LGLAIDNDVLHPKGSPEAEELKKTGTWNRKFLTVKSEKCVVAPDVWHDLVLEMRGRVLTASVDGQTVMTFTTLCGDVPKTSLGFGQSSDPEKKAVLATWFQNVVFEPIEGN